MRIVCIFREHSDVARDTIDFLENFKRRTGHDIESLDPDKNTAFCETYDVVEYPTIIARDDQGTPRATWRGFPLPLIDEVSYYL